jgi:hypothetical protein
MLRVDVMYDSDRWGWLYSSVYMYEYDATLAVCYTSAGDSSVRGSFHFLPRGASVAPLSPSPNHSLPQSLKDA